MERMYALQKNDGKFISPEHHPCTLGRALLMTLREAYVKRKIFRERPDIVGVILVQEGIGKEDLAQVRQWIVEEAKEAASKVDPDALGLLENHVRGGER